MSLVIQLLPELGQIRFNQFLSGQGFGSEAGLNMPPLLYVELDIESPQFRR